MHAITLSQTRNDRENTAITSALGSSSYERAGCINCVGHSPSRLVGCCTNWWPDNRICLALRGFLAKFFINKCGKHFMLGAGVTILNPHRLEVGDDCIIARGAWINCLGGIKIGNRSGIGPYAAISSLQHVFSNGSWRFAGSISRPITIGNDVWIASHVSIKCGTRVGNSSLVAANACVTKDIPDKVITAGVPAKVIGENTDKPAEIFDRQYSGPRHKLIVRHTALAVIYSHSQLPINC